LQLVKRITTLESDSSQLEANLDQLFLAVMGSIVFLMQVFIHKGGRGIAVSWRLTFINCS
jgi:hypothetical protein